MDYKTQSGKTIRKVQAASWTAAAVSVIMYFLNVYAFKNLPLPDPIEVSLELLISGALTGGATWLAGYLTRPRKSDTVVPDRGQPPPLESSIG